MATEEGTELLITLILQKVLPINEAKGPKERTKCAYERTLWSQFLVMVSFKTKVPKLTYFLKLHSNYKP